MLLYTQYKKVYVAYVLCRYFAFTCVADIVEYSPVVFTAANHVLFAVSAAVICLIVVCAVVIAAVLRARSQSLCTRSETRISPEGTATRAPLGGQAANDCTSPDGSRSTVATPT